MSSILFVWAIAFLSFLNAMPTTPLSPSVLQKRCTNLLQNPSFESGISPWLEMGFGAWAHRGVYTTSAGGHEGMNFYWGQSNNTATQATLSLSQSGLIIPSGTTVECSAWIASSRPGNVASSRIDVFLDKTYCGSSVDLGTTGWIKVGGKLTVTDDPQTGNSHTFTVVVSSDITGPQGSMVWVDDATLGTDC